MFKEKSRLDLFEAVCVWITMYRSIVKDMIIFRLFDLFSSRFSFMHTDHKSMSAKRFAVKVEPVNHSGMRHLSAEYNIYSILGDSAGIPRCYYYGLCGIMHNALVSVGLSRWWMPD